jgi:hypothetical protein
MEGVGWVLLGLCVAMAKSLVAAAARLLSVTTDWGQAAFLIT